MQQNVNGANILPCQKTMDNPGHWKPGVSPNPGGKPKQKPFTDALRMEAIALENGDKRKHPPGSWRSLAQALLLKGAEGDVNAIAHAADRIQGKVPQAIVGDSEEDAINIAVSRGDQARDEIAAQLARIASRVIIDVTPSEAETVSAPLDDKPKQDQ